VISVHMLCLDDCFATTTMTQTTEITQFIFGQPLNPGYATAHHWYAWHLIVMGRNDEGIAELRKAESLDPLSLIISADLADALCIAHRYDESVRQSRKTLEMDANFAIAHYQLGQAFAQKRMLNEAIGEFKRAIELSSGVPSRFVLELIDAVSG